MLPEQPSTPYKVHKYIRIHLHLLGDIYRYVYTTSLLIQRPPWKASNRYVQNDDVVRYSGSCLLVIGCQSVNDSHKVFDEYGKVVFSNTHKIGGRGSRARDVKKLYSATCGDQLYKFNDDETGYCVCTCACVCTHTHEFACGCVRVAMCVWLCACLCVYCVRVSGLCVYCMCVRVLQHFIYHRSLFLVRLISTIECLSLPSVNQSPGASLIMFGTEPSIHALPGCLVVRTMAGVYILDPVTLTPMPCKMLQTRDSDSHREDDGIPRPQFDIANCTLTILSVFNTNWSSYKKKQNIDNDVKPSSEFPDSMDSTTLVTKATVEDNQSELSIANSCYVAMAINNRLIVMKVIGW